MIKGEKGYLDDLAGRNMCKEHEAALTVAWSAEESCYFLRCGDGHPAESLVRIPSLFEEDSRGELPGGPVQDNVRKSRAKSSQSGNKPAIARTLGGAPAKDLGTKELLTLDQAHELIAYAHRYGLDPYRDHVFVMYGKPYIGIDGYLYHANKSKVQYQMASHPLSNEERRQYLVEDGTHAWLCTITIGDGAGSFTGLGIVTRDEMEAKSPRDEKKLRSPVVAAFPWHLAQKRAEWQALRRAFPIGESDPGEEE